MTHEPKGPTEGFIQDTGARFGYAYETSLKLMRALGAGGFPSAYLVDPMGTVVWGGHPAELDAATIQRHLDGALRVPMWEWPKSVSRAKKYVQKGEFAKALASLDKAKGGEAIGIPLSFVSALSTTSLRSATDTCLPSSVIVGLMSNTEPLCSVERVGSTE